MLASLSTDCAAVVVTVTNNDVQRLRVLFNGMPYGILDLPATTGSRTAELMLTDLFAWMSVHDLPYPDDREDIGVLDFLGVTESILTGVVAKTSLQLSVPLDRRPQMRSLVNVSPENRRVASVLNRPGEKHQWKLRLVDETPAAGSRPLLIYARVLFEKPTDDADVLGTVRWSRPNVPLDDMGSDEKARKRQRRSSMPPSASWGYIMAMTEVHRERPESIFTLPVDAGDLADGKIFLECEVEWPDYITGRGPRRYVVHVYQQTQPLGFLPSAMLTEAAPPPVSGKKLALLVGISKYSRRRSDLEYADDDVVRPTDFRDVQSDVGCYNGITG